MANGSDSRTTMAPAVTALAATLASLAAVIAGSLWVSLIAVIPVLLLFSRRFGITVRSVILLAAVSAGLNGTSLLIPWNTMQPVETASQESIQRILNEHLLKLNTFYQSTVIALPDTQIGRDTPGQDQPDQIRELWLEATENARLLDIPPPAGLRLIDPYGTVAAATGGGIDFPLNWPRLDPDSKTLSGIATGLLPAGAELLYWTQDADGYRWVISVPLMYSRILNFSSDLPPAGQRRGTVESWISKTISVEIENPLLTGDPDTANPHLIIEDGTVFPVRISSMPTTMETGTTEMLQNLSGLLVFLALALAILLLWRSIPENHPVILIFLTLAGIVAVYGTGRITGLFEWLLPDALFDPWLYASTSPFPEFAGTLVAFAVIAWIGTWGIPCHGSSRFLAWLALPAAPVLCAAAPAASVHMIQQLINNSGYEWWPILMLPNHPGIVVLPIAMVLLSGFIVRLAICSLEWCRYWRTAWIYLAIPLGGYFGAWLILRQNAGYLDSAVDLSMVLMCPVFFLRRRSSVSPVIQSIRGFRAASLILAVAICTPAVIDTSQSARRSIVQSNLRNWLEERDLLRKFALEANLEQFSRDPELAESLGSGNAAASFRAYALWSRSDLSAVSERYGVELYDVSGNLVDRFAPELQYQRLPGIFLERLRTGDETPVIMQFESETAGVESNLTGGIPVKRSSGAPAGYLVLRLPAGPLTTLPASGEWGHGVTVRLHHAVGGIQGSQTGPVRESEEEPDEWQYQEETQSWQLSLDALNLETGQPFRIIAAIPALKWVGHAAGIIRLLVVAVLAVLPFAVSEVFRARRRRDSRNSLTFRAQLMIAFTVMGVSIPLFLAVFQNSQITTLSRERRERFADMTLNETVRQLTHRCIAAADRVKDLVTMDPATEPSAMELLDSLNWFVLDRKGQRIRSNGTPAADFPWFRVAEVFRSGSVHAAYFTPDIGELWFRVIIPLNARTPGIPESESGTLIVEGPVTGRMLQDLLVHPTMTIDVYNLHRVAASTRPELFNTGFLSLAPPTRTITRHTNRYTPPSPRLRRIQSLQDSQGQTAGFLAVGVPLNALPRSETTNFDWTLLITALFISAGLIGASILGKRLAAPVRDLTAGAVRVARGQLDTPIPDLPAGEMGQLVRTFNRMMADLRDQRIHLEQRHRFIQALLSQISPGIAALDPANRITVHNTPFADLLHFGARDLTGHSIIQLLETNGLDSLAASVRAVRQGTAPREERLRLYFSGKIVHLKFTHALLTPADSRDPDLLIMIEDITSAVRSVQMDAYADMARRVAHEIKNPLTPIQLSIEHLQHTFNDRADSFPEIFDQCTRTILDEVRSLRKIATEFSRFARLPKPVFKNVDIRDLMTECAAIYRAPPEGIEISVSLPPYPLLCRYDHDQMKRVMINLIQNGIQAIQGSGTVTVTAFTGEADRIVIQITDTGEGMDQDTLLKLFEPYFSTRREGIGLGLVIVKATIDEHAGDIQVTSQPGQGTVFTITLPKAVNA